MRDTAVICCFFVGLVSLAIDVARLQPAHIQATIYSAENCVSCVRYIDAVKAQLPKRGLIVRDDTAADAATADVIVTKTAVAGVDSFPTTIIRKGGREVRRFSGEITPAQLIEAINR